MSANPQTKEIVSDTATPKTMPAMPPTRLRNTASVEELQQHMQSARADRHAQADLARALGHRDQQDIHDADAADEERDRGDGGEQQRHDLAASLRGAGDLTEVAHGEVVDVPRPVSGAGSTNVAVTCPIAA